MTLILSIKNSLERRKQEDISAIVTKQCLIPIEYIQNGKSPYFLKLSYQISFACRQFKFYNFELIYYLQVL